MRGHLNGQHESFIEATALPQWITPRENLAQPRERCDLVVELTDGCAVVERAPGFRVALPFADMSGRLGRKVADLLVLPRPNTMLHYVIAPEGQQPKYRSVEEG